MIEIIRIKNVALIKKIEINFSDGLNILSGETGAGKSIIIDSIGLLLGDKSKSTNFIRTKEDFAEIEGLFRINNLEVKKAIENMGIDIEEDNLIIINRIFNRIGQNSCRINGKITSVSMLKNLGELLIDIHGQHEHQSLLNKNRHLFLLDRFCSDNLFDYKKQLEIIYKQYKDLEKDIKTLTNSEREQNSMIDLYTFQIEEIFNANLSTNEEEKILERKKILSNSEKLMKNSSEALELLYENSEDNISLLDKVSKALTLLNEIANLDISMTEVSENLFTVEAELQEIVRSIRNYSDELYYDPVELNNIEIRLDEIYKLKKKYGNSIEEILNHLEKITKAIDLINNREEELIRLENKKKELYLEGTIICENISRIRIDKSLNIEKEIENVLNELGMIDAKFKIFIERQENFNQNGFDKVEFLISPNIGEPLKPLLNIASGGEMSRVMLALKTILSKVDNIETFIFDEIDTGVSGRTAQKVAEKLSLISKDNQILSITHLPQIASMADKHFLIEKESYEEETVTNILELSKEESAEEIARLISGAVITKESLDAAKQMIIMAKNLK